MTYAIVTFLWLAVLPLWACIGFSSRRLRTFSRWRSATLAAIVVASIALTLEVFGPTFHGLEYEDAFEYVYAGLLMAVDETARQQSLNPLCIRGSLNACESIATLSHPTGIATLVSWMARALGASNHYVHYISAVSFTVSGIVGYSIGRLASIPRRVAVAIPLLLFVTPSFHAIRVTSLSEPLSGTLVAAVVFLVLLQSDGQETKRTRLLISLALATTVALAVLVRRDNLLLPLAIPGSMLVLSAPGSRRQSFLTIGVPCLTGALIVLASSSIGDLAIVSNSSRAPFRVMNLIDLLPVFLRHVASIGRYGVLPLLVVVGCFSSIGTGAVRLCVALIVAYSGLFLLFGQSYYYEALQEVPTFHFERYVVELAPLLAVVGAAGLNMITEACRPWLPQSQLKSWSLGIVLLIVVSVPSVSAGGRIRREYASEEQDTRTSPIARVCSTLPAGAELVTEEPLLVGLFCGPAQRAISFRALGRQIDQDGLHKGSALYVVDSGTSVSVERARYPVASQLLDSFGYRSCNEFRSAGRTFRTCRVK